MSSQTPGEADIVDALSAPAGPVAGAAALRQAVLARTRGVIRRRRRWRRAVLVGALAGCYLAGLATHRFQAFEMPSSSPRSVARIASAPQEVSAVEPVLPAAVLATKRSVPKPVLSAEDRRLAGRKARFEVLRRLSDRYLFEDGDVVSAIRYYNRALNAATAEELEIAPDRDSWLLMALKQERSRKEISHEKSGT